MTGKLGTGLPLALGRSGTSTLPSKNGFGQTQVYIVVARSVFGQAQTSIVVIAYRVTVRADGAVVHWPLDEPSSATATDLISGLNATYTGTVTRDTNHPTQIGDGRSAAIDGSDSNFINVPTPTGLPAGNSDRSIEIWYKTTTTSQSALFGYGAQATRQQFVVLLNYAGKNLTVSAFNDDQGVNAAGFNNGSWHHLVVTYTGSTRVTEFWLDAVSQGSFVFSSNLNTTLTGSDIGRLYYANGFALNGNLSNIAVYPFVLTPSQIRAHSFGGNVAYIGSGQSRVVIVVTNLKFGQSQALINQHFASGQAQVLISLPRVFGQAQARIISFNVNRFAQAQAYIYAPLFIQSSASESLFGIWSTVLNGSTKSTTLPSALTAGNLLIAVISVQQATFATVTMSGSGWNQLIAFGDSDTYMLVYYKVVQSGDSSTVTFTNTTGSNISVAMMAAEYYGLGLNPVFTAISPKLTGSSSSGTLPTLTPRDISIAGQAVLFGFVDFRVFGGDGTWPSWNERTHYDGGAQHVLEIADRIVRNPDGVTSYTEVVTANGTSTFWRILDFIITARGPREVFAQSKTNIKQTYNTFAQANSRLIALHYVSGQAQASILKLAGYGNAQTYITIYYLTDDVNDALTIVDSQGIFYQNIDSFTADTNGPDLPDISNYHSGWINISISQTSILQLNTLGSNIDTQIAVYGTLSFYAATDNDGGVLFGDSTGYEAGGGSTSVIAAADDGRLILYPDTYLIEVSTTADEPLTQLLKFTWSLSPVAGYGQAQARLVGTRTQFGQARAILNQTFANAQVLAEIIAPRHRTGMARARILKSAGYANVTADILAIINKIGQTQARIKQTYTYSGQAQARIVYQFFQPAQAQAYFLGNAWAQAQARIKQTYNSFAQSRVWIKRERENRFGQSNSNIAFRAFHRGQAQALIRFVEPLPRCHQVETLDLLSILLYMMILYFRDIYNQKIYLT